MCNSRQLGFRTDFIGVPYIIAVQMQLMFHLGVLLQYTVNVFNLYIFL